MLCPCVIFYPNKLLSLFDSILFIFHILPKQSNPTVISETSFCSLHTVAISSGLRENVKPNNIYRILTKDGKELAGIISSLIGQPSKPHQEYTTLCTTCTTSKAGTRRGHGILWCQGPFHFCSCGPFNLKSPAKTTTGFNTPQQDKFVS